MIHKHFEPNLYGTDYVVGDIHGCYGTYMNAFDKLNFRPEIDRMFSVGDLVDRGAHSFQCLDLLKKPYFHAIRGNHEQMAIDYIDSLGDFDARHYYQTYSANGGDWFLDCHIDLQKIIAEKFRELPIVITIGDVAILHADPVLDDFNHLLGDLKREGSSIQKYTEEQVIWSRKYVYRKDQPVIKNINKIFLGHTPQPLGPSQVGNMYFIDTGCVFGHTITIYKLDGTSYISEPNIDGRYKSKYYR